MFRLTVLIPLLSIGLMVSALAFVPNDGAINQAITIPYYDNQQAYLSLLSPVDPADPAWEQFLAEHGQWAATINSLTGRIHRAYGGAVFVGIPSGQESACDKALSFLQSVEGLVRVPTQDLRLIKAANHGHHWFVDFVQVYNGLEVYGSRVSVRISDRGNVVLFECDYLPDIAISAIPALSVEAAGMAASVGLFGAASALYPNDKPLIFPIPGERGFEYRLAYLVEIPTDEPARWQTVVDANTGEILYRRNSLYYYTVDGYFSGRIYPFTPFDTLVTRPFGFQTVLVNGINPVQTDRSGLFSGTVPDSSSRAVNAELRGEFVQVLNSAGGEASYAGTIIPGDTLRVLWDNTLSLSPERNGYYHTNTVHDYIKELDPSFTGLDFALPCNVNVPGTCNAFWDGSSINFYPAGSGCSNTAEIADVIYHEYGHGITDYMYRPGSPASGAQHEGWSDYIAATITNQPLIGRGFYSGNPNQYLRTVDNNNRYPENWSGEPHNDGLILSGALWDMRQALDPRTGYCDSLWHFARYGHSGNFQDYALDILIYDDDDDNIFNRTPHWDLIMTALTAHGIAPLDRITITHQPLDDIYDNSNPYPIAMWVNATLIAPNPDSVFVYYRTIGTGPYTPIRMTQDPDPTLFMASIPIQPLGTLIEYYLSVTDFAGVVYRSPSTAPMPTYFFVVGTIAAQFADSLERSSGWTVGASGDDADAGLWERVDPNGTYADSIPNYPYQPEDDHTPDPGVNCYVTGQHPAGDPNNGANDVDHGKTSLLTPVYDISTYTNPVIEYYRWFTTSRNIDDTLFVDISGDNGVTWLPLEIVIVTENFWSKCRHLVRQVLPTADGIKLRFAAADDGAGSIVEAGVDDLTLYSLDATAIEKDQENAIPGVFALRDNYPNPFNGQTEISFDLPHSGDVSLTIYDIAGRLVYSHDMGQMPPGTHRIVWDGRADSGAELASGIYFYRLQAGERTASRKMLYLK